jgi:hypothetical protein
MPRMVCPCSCACRQSQMGMPPASAANTLRLSPLDVPVCNSAEGFHTAQHPHQAHRRKVTAPQASQRKAVQDPQVRAPALSATALPATALPKTKLRASALPQRSPASSPLQCRTARCQGLGTAKQISKNLQAQGSSKTLKAQDSLGARVAMPVQCLWRMLAPLKVRTPTAVRAMIHLPPVRACSRLVNFCLQQSVGLVYTPSSVMSLVELCCDALPCFPCGYIACIHVRLWSPSSDDASPTTGFLVG